MDLAYFIGIVIIVSLVIVCITIVSVFDGIHTSTLWKSLLGKNDSQTFSVKTSTTTSTATGVLTCLRCERAIKFVPHRAVRIRCSCGNVMNRPKNDVATNCPGCGETIHISPRGATKVRCPCGNVMTA